MKAVPFNNQQEVRVGYMIFCPGCRCGHLIHIDPHANEQTGSSWSFNGDVEKPTFRPSVLIRSYEGDTVVGVCHSFITDGKIAFLMDCTHDKKGCTIPLEDFP